MADLLAAARIDGCTEFGAFRRVALPLATPIIALVGFFSFVANWTNYFLPYVMLPQSGQYPVQVGIGLQFNPTAAGGTVLRPELALATPARDHPGPARIPVRATVPGQRVAGRRYEGVT